MDDAMFAPLKTMKGKQIENSDLTPAAVLLPIFKTDDQYQVLFTKRSDTVPHHKGEISFPGGVVDPDDASRLHTALRECEEEIGLASKDVTILGRLDDMATVSTGFVITPFVGHIPYPYKFRLNTDEIAALITAPLDTLTAQYDGKYLGRAVGNPMSPVFPVDTHLIWGATARILVQFVDIIRLPTE